MSEVIVGSPVIAASIFSAALPVIAIVGLAAGMAYMGSKALQKRDRLIQEQIERENQEISRLHEHLDQLLNEQSVSAANADREDIEKNRTRLMQELARTDFGDASLDVEKYAKRMPTQTPVEEQDYKKGIQKIFWAFSLLDPEEAHKHQSYMDELNQGVPKFRERVIFENLKISYANSLNEHSRSIWRKKKLAEMIPLLPDSAQKQFKEKMLNDLQEEKPLSEEKFENLVNYWTELYKVDLRQKENAILEEQLVAQMKKLGYSSLGSNNAQAIHYFNTPDPKYRIQAKVNPENGQLSLRFVHVVASESEKQAITTEQKRRDREKAAKWCEASRKLFALLEEDDGIKIDEIYRHEPDEKTDIQVIVDPSLSAREQSAAQMSEGSNNAAI